MGNLPAPIPSGEVALDKALNVPRNGSQVCHQYFRLVKHLRIYPLKNKGRLIFGFRRNQERAINVPASEFLHPGNTPPEIELAGGGNQIIHNLAPHTG